MICRAAMLRCPGVLATKVPTGPDTRDPSSGPANAASADEIVAVSSDGLSIDGTMPKM